MRRRKTTHEFWVGGGAKLRLEYGPRGHLRGAVLDGGEDPIWFFPRVVPLGQREIHRLARILRQEVPVP